jgi:DNA-directed RNA polymerase sigma subunit (sigma70/sigma32)
MCSSGALTQLEGREAKILRWRFGIGTKSGAGLSFGAIAKKLRISASWARELHERALVKLRAELE